MPRVADHQQRRSQIARSFQRLLADNGPTGTSFAQVAADAGLSVGLIQYYFSGRAALLAFSYRWGIEAMMGRIDDVVGAGERAGDPLADIVVRCLEQLLPLDYERIREHRVRQSLLAEAPHDPALTDVVRAVSDGLTTRLRTAIDNGKLCGEVETGVDDAVAAAMILATADGLAQQLTAGAPAPGPMSAVLDPVLGIVFTGRCHHHGSGGVRIPNGWSRSSGE